MWTMLVFTNPFNRFQSCRALHVHERSFRLLPDSSICINFGRDAYERFSFDFSVQHFSGTFLDTDKAIRIFLGDITLLLSRSALDHFTSRYTAHRRFDSLFSIFKYLASWSRQRLWLELALSCCSCVLFYLWLSVTLYCVCVCVAFALITIAEWDKVMTDV